jgi:spermidine/putrescine ABC transporter ATP-binding subunit
MLALQLVELCKRFRGVVAVDRLTLQVEAGEFVSLLGPSGCGKTTTLRMIAGLQTPDAGRILLGDQDITYQPPEKRNLGMVFQDYALFPHMTIEANVAFGLQMRRLPRDTVRNKVGKALELVRLSGLQGRYPRQLSGGQQQRVALARALVVEPQLLLLDEPLSNLDAKLRQQMRVELKLIQSEVGITTVFVTHDQEEALTLSDRIAVMRDGRLVQIGTPIETYENPQDSFVASFLGQENFFEGTVTSANGRESHVLTDRGLELVASAHPHLKPGARALLVVKKERIQVSPDQGQSAAAGLNDFPAKVNFVTYLGTTIQYVCAINNQELLVSTQNKEGLPTFQRGDRVRLAWNVQDCTSVPVAKRPPADGSDVALDGAPDASG